MKRTPSLQRSSAPGVVYGSALVACVAIAWVSPSAAFFDSGELATSAIELGVPHPTGFAIYNLLGHLAALLPLGSVGFRVNLLGVIATVIAAILAWRLCAMAALPSVPSPDSARRPHSELWTLVGLTVGVVACALSANVLGRHAASAEVYPLVWVHALACGWIWACNSGWGRVIGLSLLLGIGIALHALSALFAGFFGLLALLSVLFVRRSTVANERPLTWAVRPELPAVGALFTALLVIVVAAAALVYLPLAAHRPAAFSWGDVTTWRAFVDHVTAASIRAAFADQMGGSALAAASSLVAGLWRDVGILAAASLIGAAVLTRGARKAAVAVTVLALVDAGYSIWINPMGLRDEQCAGVLTLILLGLAAVGFQHVAGLVLSRGSATAAGRLAAVCLSVVGGVSLMSSRFVVGAAERRAAPSLIAATLAATPPGGLAVVASDHLSSLCLFSQIAEGSRPDALCLPVVFARRARMLAMASRTGRPEFRDAATAVAIASSSADMANAMAKWLRPSLATGPVRWELGSSAEDAQIRSHWLPGFPTGEVVANKPTEGEFAAQLRVAIGVATAFCARSECAAGSDASNYTGRWASVAAANAMRAGRPGVQELFAFARVYAPEDPTVLNNYAVFLLSTGLPGQALATLRVAIALHPDRWTLYRTAARAALNVGSTAAAVGYARVYLQSPRGQRVASVWLVGLLKGVDAATQAAFRRQLELDSR